MSHVIFDGRKPYVAVCWPTEEEARRELADLLRYYPEGHPWRLRLHIAPAPEGMAEKFSRWRHSASEGAKKRRCVRELTFKGRTLEMFEWAAEVGIPAKTIWWRLRAGWSVEDALTVPTVARSDRRSFRRAA